MPVSDLLLAGGELMLLGMGIVFGFLIVLVFAMRGMSALAGYWDRDQEPMVTSAGPVAGVAPSPGDQEQLTAVIAAAVARYRANRNQ